MESVFVVNEPQCMRCGLPVAKCECNPEITETQAMNEKYTGPLRMSLPGEQPATENERDENDLTKNADRQPGMKKADNGRDYPAMSLPGER